MKLFQCNHCGHPVYFENYFCINCNATLGFDPAKMDLLAVKPDGEGSLIAFSDSEANPLRQKKYTSCLNAQYNVCNWLLPAGSDRQYCVACELNRTIPDLSQAGNLEKWGRIEQAKHRLVYSLLRFRLPVQPKLAGDDDGLAFDFKADEQRPGEERLLTGHDDGIITLNIAEADDVIREMERRNMDEVYRTLLGHFRHEIGHYYWDRLIRDTGQLDAFRRLFGDESVDYGTALQQHYAKGSTDDWQTDYISAYASSHPWEDWAETWAHYLHMIDTIETAWSFGVTLNPRSADPSSQMSAREDIDPYAAINFDEIIKRWIPLTFVMNSLNRSMGMKDSYPFVINGAVQKKLNFIHNTIKQSVLPGGTPLRRAG